MLKKFCAVIMCSLLCVSNLSTAITDETSKKPVDIQVDYDSVITSTDETITYGTLNPDEIAAYYGIDDPKEVSVTIFSWESETVPILASAYLSNVYIDNVEEPSGICGTELIARNSATNSTNKTITKTITMTGTVSNTYSTSVEGDIDVKVASISSAVCFDVTKSWLMSYSTQLDLEPHKSVTVYAYLAYEIYSYDIMKNRYIGGHKKVGSGKANKCVGFCTVTK